MPTTRKGRQDQNIPRGGGRRRDLVRESMAHTQSPIRGGQQCRMTEGGGLRKLEDQAEFWATPNAPNGGRRLSQKDTLAKGATEKGKRQVPLGMQAEYFPTPAARDYKSESGGVATLKHYNDHGPTLPAMLEHSNFLTSLLDRQIHNGESSSPSIPNSRPHFAISIGSFLHVDALVYCRWAYKTGEVRLDRKKRELIFVSWVKRYVRPSLRQKLNPAFASWLMGWPEGLQSAQFPCDSRAMELYLSRQRAALRSLCG